MLARLGFVMLVTSALFGWLSAVVAAPPGGSTQATNPHLAGKDTLGDPLPAGVIARMGSSRLRHSAAVSSVVFSPDGTWLASHSAFEGFVSVWETASGKLRARLPVAGVVKMAFADDGDTIALIVPTSTFTSEILVECWDVRTGRRISRFRDLERESEDGVLMFSPKGRHLYFGRSSLRCFDCAKERLVYQLPMAEGVAALALSPDGSTLVTAEGNGSVYFRDAATGRERCRVEGVSASRLALSPDGKLLALAAAAHIELWQVPPVADQNVRVAFSKRRLPERSTIGLAFSPDGQKLLSLSAQGIACLWDVSTQASAEKSIRPMVRRHLPASKAAVGTVTFDTGGRSLALLGSDSTRALRLWNVADGLELFTERDLGNSITCLTFSADGKTLVTGGDDKVLRFWQASTGKLLGRVELPEVPCQIDFNADGQKLTAGGKGQWWSVARDGKGPPLSVRSSHKPLDGLRSGGRIPPWKTDVVDECRLTPDGFVLDVERSGVRVFDVSSGKKLCELQGSKFSGATLAPNRRSVAVLRTTEDRPLPGRGRDEIALALTELATGQEVDGWGIPRADMDGRQPWLLPCVAFAPGGRLLAAGTSRGSVLFWDLATSQQIHKLVPQETPISLLAFAPDGRTLACVYRDASVLVCDLAAVTPRADPAGPPPLDQHWQNLHAAEPPLAWKAHWGLVAGSAQTVSFLREHLRPVPSADLRPLAQKIKDLDSPKFVVRERAMKDLESMGQAAAAELRTALKNSTSLEAQRRLQRLVDKLEEAQRRQLQELRAIAVLEQIASADAMALLQVLAAGDPQAPLTIAARTARKRLGHSLA